MEIILVYYPFDLSNNTWHQIKYSLNLNTIFINYNFLKLTHKNMFHDNNTNESTNDIEYIDDNTFFEHDSSEDSDEFEQNENAFHFQICG